MGKSEKDSVQLEDGSRSQWRLTSNHWLTYWRPTGKERDTGFELRICFWTLQNKFLWGWEWWPGGHSVGRWYKWRGLSSTCTCRKLIYTWHHSKKSQDSKMSIVMSPMVSSIATWIRAKWPLQKPSPLLPFPPVPNYDQLCMSSLDSYSSWVFFYNKYIYILWGIFILSYFWDFQRQELCLICFCICSILIKCWVRTVEFEREELSEENYIKMEIKPSQN